MEPQGSTSVLSHWVLLMLLAWATAPLAQGGPVVETESGRVEGRHTFALAFNFGSHSFLGIPYAKAARFGAPRAADPWLGTLDATSPRPMCPQAACSGNFQDAICTRMMSEDCLHLSVYTPAQRWGRLLPVLVWVHGGNFVSGATGVPLFRGDSFATTGNVVVVSVNYRLGAFGFLPVFSSDGARVEGNWGLRDQIQALRWVQRNIRAFGGDPTQITAIGQSAGAESIMALLARPFDDPEVLFDKAILHSPPLTMQFKTHKDALILAQAFADAIGCAFNDLECYRSRPLSLLARVQDDPALTKVFNGSFMHSSQPWNPVIDGHLVRENMMDAIVNDNFRHVPMMAGTTREEGFLYAPMYAPGPISMAEFTAMVDQMAGNLTLAQQAVGTLYRPQDPRDARPELGHIITHFIFACPTRLLMRKLSKKGVPAYLWVYEEPLAFPYHEILGQNCVGRACHGGDVVALWNSPLQYGLLTALASDAEVAGSIQRRWAKFAGPSTDPNLFLMPPWGRYDENSERHLKLRAFFRSEGTHYLKPYCDFWDSTGYPAH